MITMDDDLQNPPEEVQRLLAFSQRSGKQVVYTYYDDESDILCGATSPAVLRAGSRISSSTNPAGCTFQLPLHERVCGTRNQAL